jgi:hypothetical protein
MTLSKVDMCSKKGVIPSSVLAGFFSINELFAQGRIITARDLKYPANS